MAAETPNIYPVYRPNYEAVRSCARQYPGVDVGAVETNIELMRITSALLAGSDAWFATQGLSRGRFFVLVMLLNEPNGLNPAELAERSQVTRATMTGLVDTLEHQEFIQRVDDPNDRRMYRVVLTDKARQFLDELLPRHFRRVADVLSHLSAQDREQLLAILKKVEAGVEETRIP